MSAPESIILRMDLTGTNFGTAPTWTDYSTYLGTGGSDGEPIQIARGGSSGDTELPASTCSFLLENLTGLWTPGNAAADPDWGVGVPVNIRLVFNSVTYDRFTGYVDSISPAFPGAGWSVVRVTASDVTSRLDKIKPLRSMAEHEILLDNPTWYYPLGEKAGATRATSLVSGQPTLVKRSTLAGPGQVAFGEDTGLIDTRQAALFSPISRGTDVVASNKFTTLQADGISVPAGNFSIMCVFQVTAKPPAKYSFVELLSDDPVFQGQVYFRMQSDGSLNFGIASGASDNSFITSGTDYADGQEHVLELAITSSRTDIEGWVDGVYQGNLSLSAISLSAINRLCIGGRLNQQRYGEWGLQGRICHVAGWEGTYTADADAVLRYQAITGNLVERTDQRFARLAGYRGLTISSGLPVGQGDMGGQATAGVNVLEALHMVARSEGPVGVYVGKTGDLSFVGRQDLYHRTPTVTLTEVDIDPAFSMQHDRQGLGNEITVTNQHTGGRFVYKDSSSQSEYGPFDIGTYEVSLTPDDDALALAQWQVQTRKTPVTRIPELRVDLITCRSVAQTQAMLDVGLFSKVTLTGLPSQAPSTTFSGIVSGTTEQIAPDVWTMGLYTTPITLEDSVLLLDDATYGILDTYRLGF